MANLLLLLASRLAGAVGAYIRRVSNDGGTTVDKQHAQEIYTDTNPYDPTLIQSCDSGKATVLYNIEPDDSDFTVDRNSTKYVLGSGGTIVSYATDEPAFEFNADGSYKGLLVEPAATNICRQSEDISTSWNPITATITTNDTTAPDGNATADKLNDNGGGGTATGVSVVQENITVSANTKYTASVFLKADQLSFASVEAQNYDGGTDGRQFFGLSGAGSLGSPSGIDDSSITAYPNGWYRCSITWTQGAADTSVDIRIYVASSISDRTVDLDGTSSIFVWGAQLEAGPIATSYIPTTTASVTRVKDDITLGSASSLIGQTEGTLYVEVDFRTVTGATQYILDVTDGTANNRLLIFVLTGNTRSYIQSGGSNVLSTFTASLSDGVQKLAFAYANGDQEFYRNGSSIATGTGSLAALATLTDIDIGQSQGEAFQANMHIRAVALFTRRLSDAECQALTTL